MGKTTIRQPQPDLWQQLEVHLDGGVDFDRLAVQQRGFIPPLADGFDGGAREVRVNLAIQHLQRQRSAVLAHNRMKQHGALHASGFGAGRENWMHIGYQLREFDVAYNAYTFGY